MSDDLLQWANYYASLGFSVIPILAKLKKPACKWEEYQKRHATQEERQKWWGNGSLYGIGIVTGAVSNGLGVIDVDTEEGREGLSKLHPDGFTTPMVKTPRGGEHYYCVHAEPLSNNAGKLPGVDFRGDGGYVVAPPSVGQNGNNYRWIQEIDAVPLAPIPSAYLSLINNSSKGGGIYGDTKTAEKMFVNGRRDNDLFHVANVLVKGGMPENKIFQVLENLMLSWGEGPDRRWIKDKIQSALKHQNTRENSLSDDVREWVLSSNGVFMSSDVAQDLGLSSRVAKKNVSKILSRLVDEGSIERYGNKNGSFRKIENICEEIDWQAADTSTVLNIKWPFQLERLVQLYPKNIIVVAGASNAGKTAFLLNTALLNAGKYHVSYFSSEMGPEELKLRLGKFDLPQKAWNGISYYDRSNNFADVIKPNDINIIDYLELTDNFFAVGGDIKAIFDKLKKGIAIIALQKKAGVDLGRGAEFSLEKARLYLSMDAGKLKIIKAKNWKDKLKNPNGKVFDFKLVNGCKFIKE